MFKKIVIADSNVKIQVSVGLDHYSYRRMLTSQYRRSRRLPGSTVIVAAGTIYAPKSLIWCSTNVLSGERIVCWIDARDIEGNPTGSSYDVQAFSGLMSGTTNGNDGSAPPSTSHDEIIYDASVDLFPQINKIITLFKDSDYEINEEGNIITKKQIINVIIFSNII